MPEVVARWVRDGEIVAGGLSDVTEARSSGLVWLDITAADEETLNEVGRLFGLHPLALEDCLHFPQRPKMDEYPDSWFVIWVTPLREEHDGIRMTEVDLFVGGDFVVTVHRERLRAIDQTVAEGPSVFARGAAGLLHELVDRLVDAALPLVDELADRLEDIEDTMLDPNLSRDAGRVAVTRLYHIRRELVAIHKVIGPERDVIRALVRTHGLVTEETFRYLQDVGDHLARAEDSIETAREVAAAVMDIYLSVQSNRMNQIMKQLTVVATIFMPLTLISGIYGMNVIRGMWPPVSEVWSFAAVTAGMLVIAVCMALYFRRKNWW